MKSLKAFTEQYSDFGGSMQRIDERIMTTDELKEIGRKYDEKAKKIISESPQELRDYIKQYIETNNKGLITSIHDTIQKHAEIKDVVENHSHMTRVVYRGISTPKELSEAEITRTEEQAKHVATTTDKKKALEYAKGDQSAADDNSADNFSYLLTYRTESWTIMFDTELFRDIVDAEFESEVVIDSRESGLVSIEQV